MTVLTERQAPIYRTCGTCKTRYVVNREGGAQNYFFCSNRCSDVEWAKRHPAPIDEDLNQ